MKLAVALVVTLLLLTGCSAQSAPPAAESSELSPSTPAEAEVMDESIYTPRATDEDEAAYLDAVYESLPERFKSAELEADTLALGHTFCEWAAEYGITTDESAQAHIDTLDKNDPGWMYSMTLALLAGKKSGELFCPEYAE